MLLNNTLKIILCNEGDQTFGGEENKVELVNPLNIINYQNSEILLGKLSPYLRGLREGRETASSRVQGTVVCSPADLRPLGNPAAVSTLCVLAAGVESPQCQLRVRGALLGTQLGLGWSMR